MYHHEALHKWTEYLSVVVVICILMSCSQSPPSKVKGWGRFRTGKFYNYANNTVDTRITRDEHYQIEEFFPTGAKCKLAIEWIDSCTYKLSYHSGNAKCTNDRFMDVTVRILEVKESSYVFEASAGGLTTYKSEIFVAK